MINYDEEIQVSESRNYSVVKHNKLIQKVSKRKYELSLLEQKLLCYIISMVKPPENGTSNPVYRYELDIRLFCRVCGIDYNSGTNYENVRNALKRLADNSFWITEGEDELLFQWITTPRIRKGTGKIIINISPDTMPYLFGMSQFFTKYELHRILALKSSYSIAMYELFRSWANQKKLILTIDELRTYLGIGEKYKEYKALRRKIIEPAIDEINKFTDLLIMWKPMKKGRSYYAIEFIIKEKRKTLDEMAYRRTMAELNKNGKNGEE